MKNSNSNNMYKHRNEFNQSLNPETAFALLKEGNQRFVQNLKKNQNLLEQVNETSEGQFPFAAILGCSDSRTSTELLFDQGLGDIFSVRLAGNIASDYAIASLEFAAKYLGAKIILVLGHTQCGAVKGTCDNLEDGMLHNIFSLIKPAVAAEKSETENRNSQNADFVTKVTGLNVDTQIKRIVSESATIRTLLKEKKVGIAGALYDVKTGKVTFYENDIFAFEHLLN
jgi:carbonic anhydrase